ncbi:unnamed protein product [Litomosoides sigmodontis]|uniref:Uncharacterized protein n=1 Tax=Litomosoides sigmodontis TaxID=42156 RepID=A0A3P6VD33_LITSI|nr:unnamed protein product [Litomosoides sigmodontis]
MELLPAERSCACFRWLKHVGSEPTEDGIEWYPFGVISSPFLLSATLNYHVENYGSELSLEVRKNLHVANVILPARSAKEAMEICEDVKTIFKDAAMNIRGLLSNDEEFNKQIPEKDRAEISQVKGVLGIKWNAYQDTIQVTMKP